MMALVAAFLPARQAARTDPAPDSAPRGRSRPSRGPVSADGAGGRGLIALGWLTGGAESQIWAAAGFR